jgi:uncharacterized membrane protein YfcA
MLRHVGELTVGIIVGFLGGLFGKGGSAVATPLLSLIGVPGFVAVAAPLPATVPGTLIASAEYWQSHLLDWQIIRWSIGIGVPATIVGAILSRFTGARPLLIATGILVLGFGVSFLIPPIQRAFSNVTNATLSEGRPSHWLIRLVLVAIGVGLTSGLLANSGGFLLAPSYVRFLRLPIKKSFACSLAVSAALAVPGTIVHAYLGHISWSVAGFLALGSVPSSYFGAKLAIHSSSGSLERWYGVALTALGLFFLLHV